MYDSSAPHFTVSAAPHYLRSTDSLTESIRFTRYCLSKYGRAEYHDNETGESWQCRSPLKKEFES